jgi:pyruvate formate lyase activating enzyme
MRMTRKEFLKTLGLGVSGFLCAGGERCFGQPKAESIQGEIFRKDGPAKPWRWSKEGFYYASDGKSVQCQVCPNLCLLEPGDRSVCRSKVNIGGKLYSLAYGNPCSVHEDPIEKKPLHHFYPGTWIFSIAATGCNFRCLNCHNWEISQKKPEEVHHVEMFPQEVVQEALKRRSPSIAYTYSEAITYYEYMLDTARIGKEAGLKNVLVSNGYINREPLLELCTVLDAANINLKSFDDRIYRSLNGGTLQPVLNTLQLLRAQGVWLEITTLVVPTYVDDPEMTKRMCGWILKTLGPDVPLHFTRFGPSYRLTRLPPTPVATLEQFRNLALSEGIHYVYLGNVPGHPGCNTYCPNCGKTLVERRGYGRTQVDVNKGRCKYCDHVVPGRWS